MKTLFLALVVLMSSMAQAAIYEDMTGVREIPTGRSGVFKFEITEIDGSGQAAAYTRPALNDLYLRALNQSSLLRQNVEAVYKANGCKPDGTYDDKDLSQMYCGEVSALDSASNTVLWSYGRGGWMSAAAEYKSILTFTSAGTGRFTSAVLEVLTSVAVEAKSASIEVGQPVVFIVTIDMRKVREIPQ